MDKLKIVGKWEYNCLKSDMELQGDVFTYKGGFEAWYKEVFLIDEAWREIREDARNFELLKRG